MALAHIKAAEFRVDGLHGCKRRRTIAVRTSWKMRARLSVRATPEAGPGLAVMADILCLVALFVQEYQKFEFNVGNFAPERKFQL